MAAADFVVVEPPLEAEREAVAVPAAVLVLLLGASGTVVFPAAIRSNDVAEPELSRAFR